MASVVDTLVQLIGFRTDNPGSDERPLAEHLATELRQRGADEVIVAEVERPHGRGAYTFARWGRPELIVNVHLDTVPPNTGWTDDPFTARVTSDRVVGLGAADTKGAIAAVLHALDGVRPTNFGVLFSGDEELGTYCLRAFLGSPHAGEVRRAVVCEPTSLAVGTRHRGIVVFEARLAGEGGHSSFADSLPAPVVDLSRLAVGLYDWGREQLHVGPPGFEGMCVNIARIDSGVAFNVVPDEARLVGSVRPPPGTSLDEVTRAIGEITGRCVPAAELSFPKEHGSFATRDVNAFERVLGERARRPVDLGFWTEAALLAEAGIDAVVFGPGDIAQAHAPDEFVTIDQLEQARDAFAALLRATGAADEAG